MRIRTKIDLFFLCCLLLAILAFSMPVFASGDKITQSNDNNAQTTGDVTTTVGGNDSLGIGIANQLGAAAIDDCMVTTQKNFTVFAYQDGKLNYWCAALHYDAIGLNEMAARMRCQMPEIRKMFGKGEDEACISANTVQPVKEVPRETPDPVAFQNALIQREDALRSDLQDELDSLRQTIEELQKARQRPVTRPEPVIQQEPFLNDDRRAKLAAIRGDE